MKRSMMHPYSTVLSLVTILVISIKCQQFKPDYKLALKYSILFLEAQRSGKLPENNRILWRGDSALADKGVDGEDLSGGYYDGTDFVKFGFTMAYATTMLSWGVQLYPEVYHSIGEFDAVIDGIKWSTDYFIKCHVSPNKFYGQIGDFETDHRFWGRPEELNMTRPAYMINETHPGSDLASEVSAALSSASIVFNNLNYSYAQTLLKHSEELYSFAKTFPGLMKFSLPVSRQYYNELNTYDEQLVWAALWLYKATNDTKYLEEAKQMFIDFNLGYRKSTCFFYNEKLVGIRLFLANITKNDKDIEYVKSFCNVAIDVAPRTPNGLIFIRQYGALPLAANTAFICSEVSKIDPKSEEKYINFTKSQIDYMLGSTGRSYVVGYGTNFPRRPHNSASSCPNVPEPCNWPQYNATEPNPQILYGALVSGPNITDYYRDEREDTYFEHNVVSLDFNVGFQNCLAALIHFGKQESVVEEDASEPIIDVNQHQHQTVVNK